MPSMPNLGTSHSLSILFLSLVVFIIQGYATLLGSCLSSAGFEYKSWFLSTGYVSFFCLCVCVWSFWFYCTGSHQNPKAREEWLGRHARAYTHGNPRAHLVPFSDIIFSRFVIWKYENVLVRHCHWKHIIFKKLFSELLILKYTHVSYLFIQKINDKINNFISKLI